jgi:hypothetical protein
MRISISYFAVIPLLLAGCGAKPLPIDYQLHLVKEEADRGITATLINQQVEQCTVSYDIIDSNGRKLVGGKQTVPGNGSIEIPEFLAPGDKVLLASRLYAPFQFTVPNDRKQVKSLRSAFQGVFDAAQKARGTADERVPGVGGIPAGGIDALIRSIESEIAQRKKANENWQRNPDSIADIKRLEAALEAAKQYKAGKK